MVTAAVISGCLVEIQLIGQREMRVHVSGSDPQTRMNRAVEIGLTADKLHYPIHLVHEGEPDEYGWQAFRDMHRDSDARICFLTSGPAPIDQRAHEPTPAADCNLCPATVPTL